MLSHSDGQGGLALYIAPRWRPLEEQLRMGPLALVSLGKLYAINSEELHFSPTILVRHSSGNSISWCVQCQAIERLQGNVAHSNEEAFSITIQCIRVFEGPPVIGGQLRGFGLRFELHIAVSAVTRHNRMAGERVVQQG